jgi:methionyl-tRNA formyltransferase
LRIVFMGTPDFAVPPLEYLVSNGYQVIAVYTQPDRRAGRSSSPVPSPVKTAARERNLPVLQPVSFKELGAVAELAGLRTDVIVVAAFGQILPQSVLDIPEHGCINLHPSLLPKFRGPSPVAAAILAGDEFTGVSLMLLERGMDTGPVLARAQVPISSRDTTGSLSEKLSWLGAQLLIDVLPRWVKGELTPQPQKEAEATYSRMLTKKEGEIDWHLPAVDIWRRVRAFNPWPVCFTLWQGRQLSIIEAMPLSRGGTAEVGRVVSVNEGEAAFGISTGDGILGVVTVQLAGKRVMSAAEFLRGQRQFIGSILPSD